MSGFSLSDLERIVTERSKASLDESWTAKLVAAGQPKAAKKLGEEAVETVIAAKNDSSQRIVEETADLLYHLLVTLVEKGVTLEDIQEEHQKRQKTGMRT